MEMEGGRGNRAKARLSSERGISRRYHAKPYVPQIRRLTLTTVTLRSLVSYFIPIGRLRDPIAHRLSKLFSALKFRKNELNFVTFSRKYFTLSPRFCNYIGFTQSRNSRGSFAVTVNLRAHEVVNRSRETSPLTDFGNHFIAHSLLT